MTFGLTELFLATLSECNILFGKNAFPNFFPLSSEAFSQIQLVRDFLFFKAFWHKRAKFPIIKRWHLRRRKKKSGQILPEPLAQQQT